MTDEGNVAINYPVWTEYRKKNGLDPLGMQNCSVSLYQTFLPGISNVTLRMRYYGLYTWLCWTYAQKIGDTTPEYWKRFIRRAEALYALIAYWHGGEGGVAGIEWAQKVLDQNQSGLIEFAQAAEPSHLRRHAPGFTALRPLRVVSICMAGGETRYNSGVVRKWQRVEIATFSGTEPIRARFARLETKAVQRLETGVSPVSEVRSPRPNPFETKRKKAPMGASSRVRDMIMAGHAR